MYTVLSVQQRERLQPGDHSKFSIFSCTPVLPSQPLSAGKTSSIYYPTLHRPIGTQPASYTSHVTHKLSCDAAARGASVERSPHARHAVSRQLPSSTHLLLCCCQFGLVCCQLCRHLLQLSRHALSSTNLDHTAAHNSGQQAVTAKPSAATATAVASDCSGAHLVTLVRQASPSRAVVMSCSYCSLGFIIRLAIMFVGAPVAVIVTETNMNIKVSSAAVSRHSVLAGPAAQHPACSGPPPASSPVLRVTAGVTCWPAAVTPHCLLQPVLLTARPAAG